MYQGHNTTFSYFFYLKLVTNCVFNTGDFNSTFLIQFLLYCEVNLPQSLIPHLIGKYSQAQVRKGGAEEEQNLKEPQAIAFFSEEEGKVELEIDDDNGAEEP